MMKSTCSAAFRFRSSGFATVFLIDLSLVYHSQALPATAMHSTVQVSDLQELDPVSIGEVNHWFQEHPTVQSCFPPDLDTTIMDEIIRFMGWLEIYLDDEQFGRDEAVNELASMQKSSRVLAWLWIHTEDVSDAEMVDRIAQGAHAFKKKAGFCFVFHPSKCKKDIGLIEKALRISFRDLQLPRRTEQLLLGNRERIHEPRAPRDDEEPFFDHDENDWTAMENI